MDMQAVASYAARWRTEGTSGEKTVTEAEWLACDHPAAMLVYLRGEVLEREREESRCRLHSSAGELFDGPSPFIPAARFTRFVAACVDRLRGFPLEDHT